MWLRITSYQSNLICIPITHSRRLLRVLWTARRSNQTILREISPGCSLVGLILKLKLQYFGHLMWRGGHFTHLKRPLCWKDWGQEEKGTTEDEMVGWHHQLDGHGFGWAPGVGDGQGGLACCGSWGAKSQTRLSDWIENVGSRRKGTFYLSEILRRDVGRQ